jgi:phosphatidylglycerol:prolipoprotein diacylglycerol transferase
VLLDIPGPIDIRWYGLMYVVGFVVGQWILVRLAKAGFWPVSPQHAPDLIVYLVLGVMLGGRLGYALFYDQDLLHPLEFIKVYKGGLSFHGGLAGVCFAVWLFVRKRKLPWLRVADACALAVTPGIFAVRFANFLNGELYGRVTQAGVGWAMRFPTDPEAYRALRISERWAMRDRELCIQVAFGRRTWESVKDQLSKRDDRDQAIDWDAVRQHLDWNAAKEHVPYRHPSQLYEGIGEGLVLGLVLLCLYLLLRKRSPRAGTFAAIFLLGYAGVRFALEYVRQPDAQFGAQGTVLAGLTMGQTLSALMVIAAVLILWLAPRRTAPAPVATSAPTGEVP